MSDWKGAHTNTIEGVWSLFKRSIDGTLHKMSVKQEVASSNPAAPTELTESGGSGDAARTAITSTGSNERRRYRTTARA